MPAFHEEVLLRTGPHELMRYCCDGHDEPKPEREEVRSTQLMLVVRGAFEVRNARGRSIADPSAIYVQTEGDEHIIRHPQDGGDVCLTVRGPIATRWARAYQGRVTVDPRRWLEIVRVAQDPAADGLALEEAVLGALPGEKPAPDPHPLADAIAHQIALCYAEPRGLSELASAVGISEFHACRVFRRARGTTIHQHRDALRLAHAASLLLDTDQSIAEIATRVGFASQAHLTHRMSRAYGQTPAALRRAQRGVKRVTRPVQGR
ncbi:MAG: AraC family transcriptional regulator [Myxococcota bacterium]